MKNKALSVIIAILLITSGILFYLNHQARNIKPINDIILQNEIKAQDSLIRVYNRQMDSMGLTIAHYQDSTKVLKKSFLIIKPQWYEKTKLIHSSTFDSVVDAIHSYTKPNVSNR